LFTALLRLGESFPEEIKEFLFAKEFDLLPAVHILY